MVLIQPLAAPGTVTVLMLFIGIVFPLIPFFRSPAIVRDAGALPDPFIAETFFVFAS